MEIASGKKTYEGTHPCTHALWNFKHGDTEFVASELGCTEEKPPTGATGLLWAFVDGDLERKWWCW